MYVNRRKVKNYIQATCAHTQTYYFTHVNTVTIKHVNIVGEKGCSMAVIYFKILLLLLY